MEKTHYETLYQTEKYHWWYRVRRHIVKDLIKRYAPGYRYLEILDVGCGTGLLMQELASFGAVHGVDISEQALAFCRQRGLTTVHPGSATQISFPDNTFDVVLCLDVLEHVDDDEAAISELARVIKAGGLLIVFVPTFLALWGTSDTISHHLRRYRLDPLAEQFNNAGLRIVRTSYFNSLLSLPIFLVRWVVRTFRIPLASENQTGSGVLNTILYTLFRLESFLLKYINFPVGVSGMIVAKK